MSWGWRRQWRRPHVMNGRQLDNRFEWKHAPVKSTHPHLHNSERHPPRFEKRAEVGRGERWRERSWMDEWCLYEFTFCPFKWKAPKALENVLCSAYSIFNRIWIVWSSRQQKMGKLEGDAASARCRCWSCFCNVFNFARLLILLIIN